MTATPRSPLAEVDLDGAPKRDRARLREPALCGQFELRAGPAARREVERRLGIELPEEPNSWRAGDGLDAYWLGPQEWLVVGRSDLGRILESAAGVAADGAWSAVVDVSDQRTALELSGPDSAEVLAGGCPVDLHPRFFGPGDCAQTVVAGSGVLLALVDGAPTFRLFVRSSFAEHLAAWLLDAIAGL